MAARCRGHPEITGGRAQCSLVLGRCRPFTGTGFFVPNFPQPRPYWLLSTGGRCPTHLDSKSRWWGCGTSLRYERLRHWPP